MRQLKLLTTIYAQLTCPINATSQSRHYDDKGNEIEAPKEGDKLYGQGVDFHRVGAVRFDSKANNTMKVEGGEERCYNFVRLMRNIK